MDTQSIQPIAQMKTMEPITPIRPWNSLEDINKTDGEQNQELSMFGDIFKNAVSQVYETQAEVEEKQYLLSTGQIDDAHSLPIAEAKAALSVNVLIGLRNKAVEAYNEFMKMNI